MIANITRRAALVGLSTFVAHPVRAQTKPRTQPTPSASESATLEKPASFEITTTRGSLKETVQKGQELIWRQKEKPNDGIFQLSNISVALLRNEAGGQVTMTFSSNISSLGYLASGEVKLNLVLQTKGGAALHSWSFGVPVKCTDKDQPLPPQKQEIPKDIADNVFVNVGTVEIAEYVEPNLPALKVQHCEAK